MRNLEVIKGGLKEPVNYKPTLGHYMSALAKLSDELGTDSAISEHFYSDPIKTQQWVWAFVKVVGRTDYNKLQVLKTAEDSHETISLLLTTISMYTPRQFMKIFPVNKEYDGARWGTVDYFSTMEEAEKIGMDTAMGDKTDLFLMSYHNMDVRLLMVSAMAVVSRALVLRGGRDPLEEWMEEQGIATHSYHEKEGVMVNRRTGEVTKVETPKRRVPQYMGVIKGGLH